MSIRKETEKINRINSSYIKKSKKLQDNVESLMNEASQTNRTDNMYWSSLKKEIKKNYNNMDQVNQSWANENHILTYKATVKKEVERLANLRKVKIEIKPYTELLKNRANQNAINVLIEDTVLSYSAALDAGYKMNLSLLNRTQLRLKQAERTLNMAIAEGLAEGEGIPKITDRVLEDLRRTLGDGLTLRAGSKRYKFETYSELIVRTRTREVQSTATINTAIGTGNDLIQVSSHNTTTEICIQFEGKIYSLSGKDPDFPIVIDTPPFHPNCIHSISIYIKEYARINNTLDQAIKFSKGKSDIHPTRVSHIPVGQR